MAKKFNYSKEMFTIRKVTIQSSYNTHKLESLLLIGSNCLIQRLDADNTYCTKLMTEDSRVDSLKTPLF